MSLRGLMSMVVVGGFIIAAVFYYLNRTVSIALRAQLQLGAFKCVCMLGCWLLSLFVLGFLGLPQVVPRVQGSIPKRAKAKKEPMGVGESFAFLAKNPYIRDLAFLVRCSDSYPFNCPELQMQMLGNFEH
jgi:ATP/ADP translocase